VHCNIAPVELAIFPVSNEIATRWLNEVKCHSILPLSLAFKLGSDHCQSLINPTSQIRQRQSLQLNIFTAMRIFLQFALIGLAASVNITVLSSKGNATSPLQYGIMFEVRLLYVTEGQLIYFYQEINHSGDGGIYAELIRNRAFQDNTLDAYLPINEANLSVVNDSVPLSSALDYHLHVTSPENGSSRIGFANTGWWGIDVKAQPYIGSFYVKGDYVGTFRASLQSTGTNQTFGSVDIRSRSTADTWTEHRFTLVPRQAASNTNNSFSITFDSEVGASSVIEQCLY
jgi:alpha-N-arabinofuranosidase